MLQYWQILVGCMALTAVAALGHRIVFGPVRVGKSSSGRTIKRFSIWERFAHTLTVLSFLTLAITGFIAVVIEREALHGWLWIIHMVAAPFFAAGITAVIFTWARDGIFAVHDWEWAKALGGYIWESHPPAGRINGGQKGYFWTVGVLGLVAILSGMLRIVPMFAPCWQELILWVHRLMALAFMCAAIVHLYMGTLANPGTIGAMLTGYVTPEWAEKHHSLWWKSLKESTGNSSNSKK